MDHPRSYPVKSTVTPLTDAEVLVYLRAETPMCTHCGTGRTVPNAVFAFPGIDGCHEPYPRPGYTCIWCGWVDETLKPGGRP